MYTIRQLETNIIKTKLTLLANESEKFRDTDIVVEQSGTAFIIFKDRPLIDYAIKTLSNYKAIIKINDKESVLVDIRLKRFILYFLIGWYIFCMLICFYSYYKNDFSFPFLFLMILAVFFLLRERYRFKKFISDFLKQLQYEK
ncbi:MAG: hypothetical protein JNM21_12315 [Taibaiella sp.]|nr:hypothetical protein [Taibaiella sp.]